jgi:hypothetical protein
MLKRHTDPETESTQSFFKSDRKKPKVFKEEIYLNVVYRKIFFEDIKKDLGEGYDDQDAENVLTMIIDEHKRDGTYQKILDAYLKEKIRTVQEEAGIIPKTNEATSSMTTAPDPNH